VIRAVVGNAIDQRLQDPRVAPLTTVTRVELTPDLLIARVYVSVPGDDAAERRTMAALKSATGFVQRLVAQSLDLRHCPELRIGVDESLKIARRTMELLKDSGGASSSEDSTDNMEEPSEDEREEPHELE